MINQFINSFCGFEVVGVESMLVYAGEDWSNVRSPGRARRRRKKHRQNIVALYNPSDEFLVDSVRQKIFCHPATGRALLSRILDAKDSTPGSNGGDL